MSVSRKMRGHQRVRPGRMPIVALHFLVLITASLACTVGPAPVDEHAIDTAVAQTLTAQSRGPVVPSATADPSATPAASSSPTDTYTPTSPPPADGVSLNCDGTYQRFRARDLGDEGTVLLLDRWDDTTWKNIWSFQSGDPMVRQLSPEAGLYAFGGCRQLLVVPLRYAGSGAVLELHIFAWSGQDLIEVYQNEGIGGDWHAQGDRIRFEKSLYLYDEPNCCPCNRQITIHRWNGAAFIEADSEIHPTYTGTPPPICQP